MSPFKFCELIRLTKDCVRLGYTGCCRAFANSTRKLEVNRTIRSKIRYSFTSYAAKKIENEIRASGDVPDSDYWAMSTAEWRYWAREGRVPFTATIRRLRYLNKFKWHCLLTLKFLRF